MRYADIKIGQRVFYNVHRMNSSVYDVSASYLAEVVKVDIPHYYRVSSGWSGDYRNAFTPKGITVRLLVSPWTDDYLSKELTTIANHLRPADGAVLRHWEDALRRRRTEGQQRAKRREIGLSLTQRLKTLGIEVDTISPGPDGRVLLPMDGLVTLVDMAESATHASPALPGEGLGYVVHRPTRTVLPVTDCEVVVVPADAFDDSLTLDEDVEIVLATPGVPMSRKES